MTHLSANDIAEWMAGEPSPQAELHVAECGRCRREIDSFAETLAGFRHSARSVVVPLPTVRMPRRAMWMRSLAVAAVAASLLVSVPVYRQYEARRRAAIFQADAQLLQQVDTEISRAVPDSMDPLVPMVSWNSKTTE